MPLAVSDLTAPSHGVSRTGAGTLFRLWAPGKSRATLVTWPEGNRRETAMERLENGYFQHECGPVASGTRYSYKLDTSNHELPDPATRWQPDGVHQPSAVFWPDEFSWTDASWKGRPLAELVIYELHVGTFTPEGTFEAIIPRLPQLVELGVTALEIMPVSQFPGGRNWGYDGVHPYAAQNTYGGPLGLQKLVDAAHVHGLAVLLDVVYNHFGPEGNYVELFGPYFTGCYHTPWGKALNYDGFECDPVRKFVIDNACQWVRDFHLDGLRLDAVQTIFDQSACHILSEIQEHVARVGAQTGRHVVVIAETDQNDARLIESTERGGYGLAGLWADDFHHSVHALVTGQTDSYYLDFGAPEQIAKSLNDGFVYDGCYSRFRKRRHGNRGSHLPRERFVTCIQNHDQVGNRPHGDRLAALCPGEAQRMAAALLLLSPATPLLFMGEEYGETRPFPFFCSFLDKGLIEAVRRGRKAEFTWHATTVKGDIPDPQAEATFDSARLAWDWSNPERAGMRRLYRTLLAARQRWCARGPRSPLLVCLEGNLLRLEGGLHPRLTIWANLGNATLVVSEPLTGSRATMLSTAEPRFGGKGPLDGLQTLAAHEVLVWSPDEHLEESDERPDWTALRPGRGAD